MTEEQDNSSFEKQQAACRWAFHEFMAGKRPMDWLVWTHPIFTSKSLTPVGKQVAVQAAETLRRFFGNDFLTNAVGNGGHPLFTLGVWPANDVPWVYANLFRLVAQIGLRGPSFWRVQTAMQTHLEAHLWVHSLLQLEVAGLGARAEWGWEYEPPRGTGRADVLLTKGTDRLLVETKSLRLSDREAEALAALDRLFQLALSLGKLGVRVSGSMGDDRFPPEEEAQWFQEITAAVQEVAQDGVTRRVSGPRGGRLEIVKDETGRNLGQIEGPPVEANDWNRLVQAIRKKNEEAANGGPVWLRVEESTMLWRSLSLQGMPLRQKFSIFGPVLQRELQGLRNLAGIILSPGAYIGGRNQQNAGGQRIEERYGLAVSCPFPWGWSKEAIVVPRGGMPNAEAKIFAD